MLKGVMRLLSTAHLATLFALSYSLGCSAAPAVGERFGDWQHECEAGSGPAPVCALTQVVLAADGQQPVLKLTIRKLGRAEAPVLVALAPLGIYLPSGVVARVDSGPQFPLVVQTCTALGCEAIAALDPKQLWRMKAGKQLLIGFKAQRGPSTVTLAISLEGVSGGLQAMGWQSW